MEEVCSIFHLVHVDFWLYVFLDYHTGVHSVWVLEGFSLKFDFLTHPHQSKGADEDGEEVFHGFTRR